MATAPATSAPPELPIGPARDEWHAMPPAERDRFYTQVFDALNALPEAMSEGRPHSRARSSAIDALTRHFRSTGRTIYVADDLAVIYPGEPVFSPDLLAVLDVPQPDPDEDERMAWVVVDEGRGPDFVLEVLHKGNRDKDLRRNVTELARPRVSRRSTRDRYSICPVASARATAWERVRTPSLSRMCSTWVRTVAWLTPRRRAMR